MITTEVIHGSRAMWEQFTPESTSLHARIYRTHLADAVSFVVLASYKPMQVLQQERHRRDGGSRADWAKRARLAYSHTYPKGW
jgi:hypothetical protein